MIIFEIDHPDLKSAQHRHPKTTIYALSNFKKRKGHKMIDLKKNKTAIAAVALIAATQMGITTASAEVNAPKDKPAIVELDNQATGSIQTCDPFASNADIICRITQGNPNPQFPSAPTGNFGI